MRKFFLSCNPLSQHCNFLAKLSLACISSRDSLRVLILPFLKPFHWILKCGYKCADCNIFVRHCNIVAKFSLAHVFTCANFAFSETLSLHSKMWLQMCRLWYFCASLQYILLQNYLWHVSLRVPILPFPNPADLKAGMSCQTCTASTFEKNSNITKYAHKKIFRYLIQKLTSKLGWAAKSAQLQHLREKI